MVTRWRAIDRLSRPLRYSEARKSTTSPRWMSFTPSSREATKEPNLQISRRYAWTVLSESPFSTRRLFRNVSICDSTPMAFRSAERCCPDRGPAILSSRERLVGPLVDEVSKNVADSYGEGFDRDWFPGDVPGCLSAELRC